MTQHASANGASIAYDVHGSGPPLILIMGFRLSSSAWPTDFVERLAERFTVVTFDNRGTGSSDKPTSGYALSNMAADVVGLMDHLGLDRPSVLGYSMGGAIAQELVTGYPDRVGSLVLFSTFCGGARTAYADLSVVRTMRNLEGLAPAEAARKSWAVTYEPGYLAANRDKVERQMQREIATPTPLHAADLQFQALVDFDASRALPGVRARTLVVTGDRDRLILPRNSELIAELIPGARLILLRGRGHRAIWEAPEECVTLVADFLNSGDEAPRSRKPNAAEKLPFRASRRSCS
jgi:3-oxoadipate enol-lactonase